MRTSSQMLFSVMVDYMEKNGDISKSPPGSQGRLDNLQNWLELGELLNKARGEPKPLEKWRKAWSDFKNNTKKKVRKIRNNADEGLALTDTEKRLMKLLKEENTVKQRHKTDDELQFKEEIDLDDPVQELSAQKHGSATRRRKSREPSYTSESSSEETSEKRKRYSNEVKEVTDRYFEFEREREKMAHEREMARLKQNDEIISIFGRMVSVLESLSPSIQKYLNNNINEGG